VVNPIVERRRQLVDLRLSGMLLSLPLALVGVQARDDIPNDHLQELGVDRFPSSACGRPVIVRGRLLGAAVGVSRG
jgi:hypothetical protein